MAVLPFPPWMPDQDIVNGQFTKTVQNVLPRQDGYGPWKSLNAFSQALPSACRGYFYGRNSDGTVTIFAGTAASKLYKLNPTDLSWTDVSLGGATYSALPTSNHWQFAQFGNLVIAVQPNVVPQVFTLGVSSAFANLGGSPPQAAYISIINRFVVLTGLLSTPFRIQWSGLSSATTWTQGTNFSDFQDFPDGGPVLGAAGGEYGIVFQASVIRRMLYQTGNLPVFSFEKVTEDKGLVAPYSIVKAGTQILFLAQQGFQSMGATGVPTPIGKEKFDRFFFNNYDSSQLQLIIGASDPEAPRCYFAFKSQAGTAGAFDRIICYDYALDRATLCIGVSGDYMATLSAPGTTLEALDKVAAGVITITGTANNGAGLIRLTLSGTNPSWTYGQADTGHSVGQAGSTNLSNSSQNTVEVYGVVGTTEANGNWAFTYIDATHIDLVGSTFTNAYVSGGAIGGALDSLTFSLDDIALSALPKTSMFNSANHSLSFFSNLPLEATIDTAEEEQEEGQRVRVQGIRPMTDAPVVFSSVGYRENPNIAVAFAADTTVGNPTAESAITDSGNCPANVSTRLARARLRIPAGTVWTYANGAIPDFELEGYR